MVLTPLILQVTLTPLISTCKKVEIIYIFSYRASWNETRSCIHQQKKTRKPHLEISAFSFVNYLAYGDR